MIPEPQTTQEVCYMAFWGLVDAKHLAFWLHNHGWFPYQVTWFINLCIGA